MPLDLVRDGHWSLSAGRARPRRDGVGGRAAGEIASALTVETFQQHATELHQAVEAYAAAPGWETRNATLELLGLSGYR